MTNVVDIVSRSPDIQKHLADELDNAFPGRMSAGWVADFQTVNQLPVLNAVVRETMRLKPTSSTGLERVTPPGGKVIAGIFIPEGVSISVLNQIVKASTHAHDWIDSGQRPDLENSSR
jgi:benzoate 4-monooxygenase